MGGCRILRLIPQGGESTGPEMSFGGQPGHPRLDHDPVGRLGMPARGWPTHM